MVFLYYFNINRECMPDKNHRFHNLKIGLDSGIKLMTSKTYREFFPQVHLE